MNKSFSDMWGEFVDLTNTRGNDNAAVRWDVGEDLPDGRVRSMKDPPALGHPDRLGSLLYRPPPPQPNQANDYGGVHSNSGVGNKLCCLLTVRQGVTNALANDTLHVPSGNYNETLTVSNRLTLKSLNGPTTIGKP